MLLPHLRRTVRHFASRIGVSTQEDNSPAKRERQRPSCKSALGSGGEDSFLGPEVKILYHPHALGATAFRLPKRESYSVVDKVSSWLRSLGRQSYSG